jgi:hypothetical protein
MPSAAGSPRAWPRRSWCPGSTSIWRYCWRSPCLTQVGTRKGLIGVGVV